MNTSVLAVIMIIGAIASARSAGTKNRNVVYWGALGAMFPLISFLILAALKPVPAPAEPGGVQ